MEGMQLFVLIGNGESVPPQAEAGSVPALTPRVELPSFLQSLVTGAGRPERTSFTISPMGFSPSLLMGCTKQRLR